MTNLIPEKRLDRNGKLVTKHVRAEATQRSQKASLPSPQLGGTVIKKAPQKPFKPRPAQVEQNYQSFNSGRFKVDSRLDAHPNPDSYYGFTASDVEMYEVFAATTRGGDALHMLQAGVRSAEEVKKYLKKHKAIDLLADRGFAQEALVKNIPAFDFITLDEHMEQQQRDSPHYVDLIRFKNSSLDSGMNSLVADDITNGSISFDDIKSVGITKLKSYDMLSSLQGAFKALKRGESGYTVDSIKALIARAREDKVNDFRDFNYVTRVLDKVGMEPVLRSRHLQALSGSYHSYNIAPGSNKYRDSGDGIERAVYATELAGARNGIVSIYFSDEFYEAGIPIDVAMEVVGNGGGLREAIAIHEEGIQSSVSSGWL